MAYCMVFLPIRQASELLTRVSQQQQQMQDPINPLKVVSNSNVQKPCQREKLLNKQPLWGVLTEGPPIFYVLENVTYWNISILVIQKQLWKRGTPSEKSSFEVGTSRWYFLNIYIYIHTFFHVHPDILVRWSIWSNFCPGHIFQRRCSNHHHHLPTEGCYGLLTQREPLQKAGLCGFANNDQCIQCGIIILMIIVAYFLFLFMSLIIVVIWCVIYHRKSLECILLYRDLPPKA